MLELDRTSTSTALSKGNPPVQAAWRGSRKIDYSNWKVCEERGRAAERRRAAAAAGSFVIARFVECDGLTCIEGVPLNPGNFIDDTAEPTLHLEHMAKWSTRQGVHQWLKAHPRWHDFHPINFKLLISGRQRRQLH